MTIIEYLEKIRFDNFKLYYREHKYSEYTFIDNVHKSELLKQYQHIENSILSSNCVVNNTFQQIATSSNKAELIHVFEDLEQTFFPSRKNTVYNVAIVLECEKTIVGGINIDIRNRISKSIDEDVLFISNLNVERLIEIYNKYNCQITKFYLPPSIPMIDNWRNYEFPEEFGFNPAFGVFETRINSGLMCDNFVHARLEISPINGSVTQEQIKRVYGIEGRKHSINNYLLDNFWLSYNSLKGDYELPELTDKKQLMYFVKMDGYIVPENDDEPITISFRTWDQEHGQTVYFYNENRIEFE
ncbi:hypothetical protein [Cytophaga aurantiaca]|uniref:hypothetical protein n=1 Tax=Cytophaga aurantiaca TaxID=29530 RepID=UPI0003777F49|nr:hypothetical protein [Cytophaga aurantiaca]